MVIWLGFGGLSTTGYALELIWPLDTFRGDSDFQMKQTASEAQWELSISGVGPCTLPILDEQFDKE